MNFISSWTAQPTTFRTCLHFHALWIFQNLQIVLGLHIYLSNTEGWCKCRWLRCLTRPVTKMDIRMNFRKQFRWLNQLNIQNSLKILLFCNSCPKRPCMLFVLPFLHQPKFDESLTSLFFRSFTMNTSKW